MNREKINFEYKEREREKEEEQQRQRRNKVIEYTKRYLNIKRKG